MRTKPNDCRATAPQVRAGFTLLELLIVIGIIAFILSIAITVFANFIRSAKVNQTAATIAKIQAIMDQRIEAFNKQNFTAAARKIASQTGLPERTALIFAKKQAFKQAFPQTLRDFPSTVPAPFSAVPTADIDKPYVSSALLYLALTQGPTFGAPAVEADAFRASELDSVGSVKYFVDAWGAPLRFYRWPTRLFRYGEDFNGNGATDPGEDVDQDGSLDPAGNSLFPSSPPPMNDPATWNPVFRTLSSQLIAGLPVQRTSTDLNGVSYGQNNSDPLDPLAKDPDDPLGLLKGVLSTQTLRNQFESGTGSYPLNVPWHTFGTYHTPLIVSAGPDQQLGLYEPSGDSAQPTAASLRLAMPLPIVLSSIELLPQASRGKSDYLTDNITNRNQRTGGN
jgi:prepilin-type N-terminal cleavage/methylation domain-containing protein